MQSTETWKPVTGYEGVYEVSDCGRVRNVRAHHILKAAPNPEGRLAVSLRGRTVAVHRLMAFAFLGDPASGDMQVCHNDGNPQNNVIGNLRWDTRSGNMRDAVRHGTQNMVRKTHCPSGHEYTEENTYRTPSRPNARYCRECKAIDSRKRMMRKKVT